MKYWEERNLNAQQAITEKNTKQIEKQLKKYYGNSMKRVISDFEAVYNKLLLTAAEGKQPSPADLYKLDAYWQMQGQLKRELQKLGDKQISALSKIFEINFFDVYYSIGIPGQEAFNTISKEAAIQLINSIWVADNRSWSQRIWDNTERLVETLNESLIHCVVAGKKTTELKNLLQERFDVSYSRADALVRTEIAHVQTQAAKQRYMDYGIEEVQVWADKDERRCPICAKLHKKIYPVGAAMPIPAHPNCRCCVIPVVE